MRSSVREPTDCPMHRIEIALPAVGPSFMMEVMVLGAFGAQLCQALKTRAAFGCDSSHRRRIPARRSGERCAIRTGWQCRNCRHAASAGPEQSGSEVAVAFSVLACASIKVTCWRLSQVRPCDLASNPCPPPNEWRQSRPSGNCRLETHSRRSRALDIRRRAKLLLRGHQSRARVHRDFLQAPKVDYDVGRLRKSFVGMASAPHREGQAI